MLDAFGIKVALPGLLQAAVELRRLQNQLLHREEGRMNTMHVDCAGKSDRGKVREMNQDRFLIADLSKCLRIVATNLAHGEQQALVQDSLGKLLVVADGMGGHRSGDRASAVAVRSIVQYTQNCMRWFFRLCDDPEDDFLDDLRAALEHCQSQVLADADSDPGREGMGTTLTAAYVVWPRLYVVHVGDSRAYQLRDAKLHQITRDHTVAQKMADEGDVSEEELKGTRFHHMLWNCIGGSDGDPSPDVYKAELAAGDALLLCSDGLTKHLDSEAIVQLVSESGSAEDACRRLVDTANEAGGRDNITVVLAKFVEGR
jgi:PPM family protein phosphatase